jgi:hypothetical protein
MTKWTLIDGDMDWRRYEHPIEGRMTKLRYKILSRYARKKSWRESCGHEWDCCGCMFSEGMSLSYIDGKWKLILGQSFNY